MICCANRLTDYRGPFRRFTSAPARLIRIAPLLLVVLVAAACSSGRPADAELRQLIESSSRFQAPNVLTIRPQYCATVDAPDENVSTGIGRLTALESAGAIRIERRAAAPNECTSLPGPLKERLIVSLADSSASFHPKAIEGGGWEFLLARRQFVGLGEITFNPHTEPPLARAVYRWAWKSELLGQLMQVSEEPVNAQATFVGGEDGWGVRDVGF
jgi:hypothetical protein